jgi:hypothetical protein
LNSAKDALVDINIALGSRCIESFEGHEFRTPGRLPTCKLKHHKERTKEFDVLFMKLLNFSLIPARRVARLGKVALDTVQKIRTKLL